MKAALTPHITEKSYRTVEAVEGSTYTFKVPTSFSKADVKAMVERDHKVSVVDVRTIRMEGKIRRFKGIAGRTNAFKKALVRLKKGDKIAAFDIDTQSEPKDKE